MRAFQQSRGLSADGIVGEETWLVLDGARWRLGQRALYHGVSDPFTGDDVVQLQERLLEMGYDPGRCDGIYGQRTARAVAQFQREVGLDPDGSCGPQTLNALRRLGRKVVGGRPQLLRETVAFGSSGPALLGKRIVIDPGTAGPTPVSWCATACCGGPRPTWRSTSRPGSRAGWRRPACGCTSPAGPAPGAGVRPRAGRARQRSRRRPVHLAAHRRPPEPGRRTAWPRTTSAPRRASRRRWGSGSPASCSARSWPAPGCGTARPTPRSGTCCG